jgi:predicted secreted protein
MTAAFKKWWENMMKHCTGRKTPDPRETTAFQAGYEAGYRDGAATADQCPGGETF